eukprot:TRINITY_DN76470_c0_g1_i1.p1 TRINITY_DN76470_c0_g1~~TRINITY_DN76470_c0_g1_i1.p1  ORF type:complete len:314 (+),score=35.83 TRINITY_DN76470_c0_g1_i1:49-990(+)
MGAELADVPSDTQNALFKQQAWRRQWRISEGVQRAAQDTRSPWAVDEQETGSQRAGTPNSARRSEQDAPCAGMPTAMGGPEERNDSIFTPRRTSDACSAATATVPVVLSALRGQQALGEHDSPAMRKARHLSSAGPSLGFVYPSGDKNGLTTSALQSTAGRLGASPREGMALRPPLPPSTPRPVCASSNSDAADCTMKDLSPGSAPLNPRASSWTPRSGGNTAASTGASIIVGLSKLDHHPLSHSVRRAQYRDDAVFHTTGGTHRVGDGSLRSGGDPVGGIHRIGGPSSVCNRELQKPYTYQSCGGLGETGGR